VPSQSASRSIEQEVIVTRLDVSAVVLASQDSIGYGINSNQIAVGISVSTSTGAALVGLEEAQVHIALVAGDQVQRPAFHFSLEVQEEDENGPKVTDDGPVMVRSPGPARPLGLSGFYLILLNPPTTGWMSTPFAVEVAIQGDAEYGQTFASFAAEAQRFRLESSQYAKDTYAVVTNHTNLITRIGKHLKVPGV
jgi:hypothetical protein